MGREPQAKKESFGDVFLARLDKIVEDAEAAGINLTIVCALAGISRATPDRWRRNLPKTISLIETMEGIIEEHRKSTAKKK